MVVAYRLAFGSIPQALVARRSRGCFALGLDRDGLTNGVWLVVAAFAGVPSTSFVSFARCLGLEGTAERTRTRHRSQRCSTLFISIAHVAAWNGIACPLRSCRRGTHPGRDEGECDTGAVGVKNIGGGACKIEWVGLEALFVDQTIRRADAVGVSP